MIKGRGASPGGVGVISVADTSGGGDGRASARDVRTGGRGVVMFGVVPDAIHANAPRTAALATNAIFFIARAPPAFRASRLSRARLRPNSSDECSRARR